MHNLTPEQIIQLKERTIKIVRENASVQKTPVQRENYFNSCIKHGGLLAEVVNEIKKEFI